MLRAAMPRDHDSRSDNDPALAPTAVADTWSPTEAAAAEHGHAALLTETAPDVIGGRELPDGAGLTAGFTLKHYEILRRLGQGGMGAVFLARDTKLGRLVAIKVLLQHSGAGGGRFLAEARATARCKHDNIVVIHEVDEIRGTPYMVLEYLEGRTLRDWMAQRGRTGVSEPPGRHSAPGPLPPSVIVELIIPVVRALGCAHSIGIVHRDLKPENILLTDSGLVKVLDFGIAKQLDVTALEVTAGERPSVTGATQPIFHGAGLTQKGALLGTLPYMSPEQLRAEEIDPRSDLWAVGLILYELCIGTHPFEPFTLARLPEVANLDEPVPSASANRTDVGALGAVIDRCLKKRKTERFGSAEELCAALEPLLPGRTAMQVGEDESPFAGLAAFQETDAARFFGREVEVAAVTGRLRKQRLIAVAGPSGAGKSSFVRAGVIPALKRSGEQWEAFTLRPGRRPLAALADVLAQVIEATDPEQLVAAFHSQPGLLGATLRAHCRRQGSSHHVLIFVDQFEELYTQGIDPTERAAFVTSLEGVADDASSPLRVVLAIRSDFLDRLAADRRFMTEVTRGLAFLSPMGTDGLREALTRPIEAAGYRFESEDMVESMLSALERTSSPLPLLQFTAAKLWEARDRERKLLTRDSYDTLGGVEGALSVHADAVLTALSLPDQRLCRAVLLRLCTPERTRAVVSLGELRALAEDGGAVDEVIDHLAEARLLLIETGGEREGTTVELVHESLIERWAKLKQWLDESEQDAQFLARLRAAAQQWEASEQADGLLWRDRAAVDARAWLEHRRADQATGAHLGLGKREEQYLVAVVALFERARRMRWRIAAGVFALLSGIAVVVSYLAVRANREAARADREATLAQAEAVQARNATRMAAARELQHSDPTAALALLREVEPPSLPRSWADLAFGTLYSGLTLAMLFHPESISFAAWSPDGKRIATASRDKIARVWNADGTGEPLVLRGHDNWIRSVAFSSDGKRIITASQDRTVRVWNADGTGEPLVLRGYEGSVYSAAWSPDGKHVVTASEDKTVRVWNADGIGEPLVLRGHEGWISSAAWSPDGKHIVTASQDKTARVWNADGTGPILILRNPEGLVYSAAWSPDGKRIITACQDRTARVWNADGTGPILILRGHEGLLYSAAWSPDGERIVTGSHDKTARVWNADGTGPVLILRGHEGLLYWAAWSPDSKRIVTASDDKTARVWNADRPGAPLVVDIHDEVYSAAWSPDGERIATASKDKTARVWKADGTGALLVLRGHENDVNSVVFSADGQRIATASADKTARIWNADGTGEPLIFRGHEEGLQSAAWSPDGKRIITASADKTARVWNADGTGEPLVLRGHENSVASAAWSPDGKRIITASADKTVRVWNADGTGEPLVLRGHENSVASAAWSPDGKRIVTASQDKAARVWNADGTGEPVVLRAHESFVSSAAWSPDGKRIVTASWDKTARVWNADGTGEPLVLRGHEAIVASAVWSPDGKRIVTASADKTARVWFDLEPLRGPDDPRLWTATPYCMPIGRRIELLNVSEATARADQEACQRRVEEARAAAAGP